MERRKAGTKEKISPDRVNYPNQNTILINIILQALYKIRKNFNETQLTKNKNGLKQSNNEKSSTLP